MEHISSPIIKWCESKLMIPDLDPEFRKALVEYIQSEKKKLSTPTDWQINEE